MSIRPLTKYIETLVRGILGLSLAVSCQPGPKARFVHPALDGLLRLELREIGELAAADVQEWPTPNFGHKRWRWIAGRL
jgi:hypothetical protein